MQSPTDEGVITHLERLNNSINGNPAYRVTLDNGNSYRTQSDSSVSYEINNGTYRDATVRLLLTKAHRIYDISVV
jgi:hypothetical protein